MNSSVVRTACSSRSMLRAAPGLLRCMVSCVSPASGSMMLRCSVPGPTAGRSVGVGAGVGVAVGRGVEVGRRVAVGSGVGVGVGVAVDAGVEVAVGTGVGRCGRQGSDSWLRASPSAQRASTSVLAPFRSERAPSVRPSALPSPAYPRRSRERAQRLPPYASSVTTSMASPAATVTLSKPIFSPP